MVGFTPRAIVFLVVSQQRRFAAQNDKETEGLGCLLGICPEFARNLPGVCSELGVRSECARTFFFCSGEGKGEPKSPGRDGDRFLIENPRRGGVLPGEGGAHRRV